jgi:hypothetical protein
MAATLLPVILRSVVEFAGTDEPGNLNAMQRSARGVEEHFVRLSTDRIKTRNWFCFAHLASSPAFPY